MCKANPRTKYDEGSGETAHIKGNDPEPGDRNNNTSRIIKGTATLKLNNLKSKRLLNHATVHKSGTNRMKNKKVTVVCTVDN